MTAENNTPNPGAPDTIVLIHGLWVTPRSWEHWIERYEGRGYRVLAPAYPGLEVEVEALNEDPSPIEALTVPAVVEHYEGIVGELERPPIIMGHSFGGLLVQILLDHGYGAAGVAIDSVPAEGVKVVPVSQIRASFPVLGDPGGVSEGVGGPRRFFRAPPSGGLPGRSPPARGRGGGGVAKAPAPAEGVKVVPVSQIRASSPVLRTPANRHRAVPFTPEQFHYAFTNTLSAEESRAVYERYHIPAPGSFVWGGVLANFTPGHQDSYVNFRNEDQIGRAHV